MRKIRNSKRIIKKLLIFVLMFLPLAMILIEPIQSIAVSPTTINLWTYGQTTAPNHAHIWSMKFDEKYHWEECSVCLTTRNKVAHTLVGNGGSKVDCDNGYFNQAYRETCSCGFQGKPQVVIHGRYENYTNCRTLNYGSMSGQTFDSVKHISNAEFQDLLNGTNNSGKNPDRQRLPANMGGQAYTWNAVDDEGLGLIFMGGPVMSDARGVRGTLEMIIGTEGDCGKHSIFDEYFILARYIYSTTNPTRSGFISYMEHDTPNAAYINNSDHMLYGYPAKYRNRVTDAQWNRIVAVFKDYYTHTSNWGWSSMNIQHAGHPNSGNTIYGTGACYDSSNHHAFSTTDGIKTNCDICGCSYVGDESYVAHTWYNCAEHQWMANGETKRCSGHVLTGKYDTKLGTMYCNFTRSNGVTRRTSITVVPEPGFSVIENTTTQYANMEVPKSDTTVPSSQWGYYGSVTLSNNKSGSALIKRELYCGVYYAYIDTVAPTAYSYTNNQTNNSYWKVDGRGTATSPKTQCFVTVSFKDPQEYSRNVVSVRVYDSDQTTVLPQGNDVTETPLTKVAGTSGDNTVWTGTINVKTEIYGSKNIYLQGIDSSGRKSSLIPMQITYIDSQGPKLNVTADIGNSTWSTAKLLTVSGSDAYIYFAIGTSAEDMVQVGNTTYNNQRQYNVIGDVYSGTKTIRFYGQDRAGNVTYKDYSVGRIDNTKPTITADNKTTVRSSTANAYVAKFTINANDINTTLNESGSGVTHYMMTIDDAVPSASASGWQTSNSFQTTENGYYYFWAKDLVGNVSSVREVYVSDLTAQYKVNHYLQDIDTTTNQPKSTYTLANEETFYGIIGRTYHLSTKIYDGFESPAIQRITVDSSGNQVVNYYYTRKTDCEYTVKYLELNTNTQLERPRTITNQTYGSLINSVNEKIDIEGYNYNSAVPAQITVGTGDNTITLYYTKVNDLKYYVHYINEDTNEEIRPVKVVENQTYQDVVSTLPNKIDIDGYNFSRITPETLKISLEESLNVVNIYYNQRRDLIYTVDYLDVDTNATLHEPKVYSNQVFNTTINGQREIIGIEGYDYHSIAPAILTIGTDNNENIINIYYKRITNLSYTINYYLQGTTTKLATSVVETNQPYDKEVLAEDYIIPIDGYNYAGESKDKIRLKINNEENVIDIYYTRREGIEYTVNYLEKGTNTRLKTSKTTGATFGDVKEALDEKVEIAGYNYKDANPQSLTITTNSSTNVINIYYEKKTDLEYTVYFAEKDSPHNDIKSAKTIRNQTFGNRIQASTQVEPITGFTYSSADPTELVIRENNEENIMNLYYVRRTDLTYTINYIEAGTTHKIKTSKVVNNVAFEKQVFARFEAIEIDGFVYQNADVESITVGENAANNVINLYYRRLNNLSYTVNYYEKNTTTRLRQSKIVEGKSFEDVINSANEVEDIPGYNFSEADKSTLVISSDINANVINLYYTKRTDISYKVNYYIEGTRIKAKESKVVSNKQIGDIVYALDEKIEIDRYIYRGSEQDSIIIDADTNNNVINLYYARISNLIVRFLDKNTNEPVRNELRYTSLVGDNYEIGDINTEVEGYELVQSPSSTSGQFAYNDTYLTYYYSRSTYVKVKYLDKGTNEELADTEIINGYVGKQYTTVKKDIPGYNYFNNTGNTSGYMASGETLVIYYYTQDVTLTVQYLDKYTEEELSNTITQEGYVGKQYTTTLKNINGYTHVETQGIPSGVMTEGENKVIYYYAKDTKVTVKYQNNNTHEDLRTSEEIAGYQGKHYTTEPKEISSWTLVGDSGNTTGEMAREGTTVIYYYQKQATVRVKYIDEETGETIQEDRVIEGSIGQEYSVNPATISGYKYLSSSGNETGRMGRNEIVVTFKYGKASGLVIKYVDLYSQEEISEEKIYEAYSSDTYDVTNERKTISNYTYITDSGNTIGEYRNTLTEVIFYYSTNTTGKLKYKDLYTGEEIQDEETIYGYEGKEISYEPDTINSYTFIKTDINLPARFKKEGTEVNNLYAKNSKMKVKYRDYYTGELIEEKTIPGYQGKEYNPSDVLEEIDGYKVLKQYEDIGGEFPRDDSELTVYYAKISNIIIQYIDANSNQKLRNDKIIEKQSGDTYDVSSEKKAIDNYVLINDPTTKGTILQEDIVIVFKYGKKTQIIVEITDEETGEVIERIVIDGYEGMPFSIDVYEREGYIYKGSSAPLSGIMKLENGVIKLFYMKDPNYNKKGDGDDSDKDKGQEEVNPATEDETTARTILPQTGETITYIVIAVVIITGIGIFTFIKQYEK